MNQPTMNILGEEIPVHHEMLSIDKLKYLSKNPRVYSCIYGKDIPDDPDEIQDLIGKQMLEEPSVKKLIPSIKNHGGLQESILVRHDTMEVIEGNSRLAAYRDLHQKDRGNKERWSKISCLVVSKLTDKQQYAYLNQMHVEGKTSWMTYEKANQAYIMKEVDKFTDQEIMDTINITSIELAKRIKVIQMMEQNNDKERSHFSHYNVLVRTKKIAEELEVNPHLEKVLISKIVSQRETDSQETILKAQSLRDKLPTIIAKKKVLKKFMDGSLSLEDAYQNARLSGVHQNLKLALEKVQDVEKADVEKLSVQDLNAALITARKLCKESNRLKSIFIKVKGS